MESLRQIGAGFLLGIISIIVVIGGFALSMAEGGADVAVSSPTALPSAIVVTVYPTIYPTIPLLTDTPQAIATVQVTDTPAPTLTLPASPTPPPPPTSCLPPAGWVAIYIQGYETLSSMAQKYQTTQDAIKQGNCLFSDQLVSGSFLYVPPRPTATFIPCGAPYGWINYYVVPGDTLFSISVRYRVTVADLQRANCLGNSTFIASGKPIKVPNVPISTSSIKTSTWTASPTLVVASPTLTPVPPSATASSIPPAVLTQTAAAATQAAVAATQTAAAATQASIDATAAAAAAATQASVDATAAAAATQAAANATAAAATQEAAAATAAAATQTAAAQQ